MQEDKQQDTASSLGAYLTDFMLRKHNMEIRSTRRFSPANFSQNATAECYFADRSKG
jgi:hypothetical protein